MEVCDFGRAVRKVQTKSPQHQNVASGTTLAKVTYPPDLLPWSLHLFLNLDGMDTRGQRPKSVFWRPKGVFRRPVRTRPGILASCTFFWKKTEIWKKNPFGPIDARWVYLHPFTDCECEKCCVATITERDKELSHDAFMASHPMLEGLLGQHRPQWP